MNGLPFTRNKTFIDMNNEGLMQKQIFSITVVVILLLSGHCVSQIKQSAAPTLADVKTLFTDTQLGWIDLSESLTKIVKYKNLSIPALSEYLATPQFKKDSTDIEPSKIYAILALEGIATPEAYAVLVKTVRTHPQSEVRGAALRVFATTCYGNAAEDGLSPNKEYLHLLIQKSDDTTYVDFCHKRMGEIAREGIRNWTGEDYGDLSPKPLTMKSNDGKSDIRVEEYRETQWVKNNGNLTWDKKTGHFQTTK